MGDAGDESGDTGNGNEFDSAFGAWIVELLETDDETLGRMSAGFLTPRMGNEMLHGTCETKASEPKYDIREAFALDMVPTSALKLDHALLTSCGPVGDAHVFCPTGGMPVFGDYVLLSGFALGGDPGLGAPNTRTQIGLTVKSEGGTPWEPLPQFMCDSWGNMTNFFNVNAATMGDGILTGNAEYSMPDGMGGIQAMPADGILIWQNGMVLGVLNRPETAPMFTGIRFNVDFGPIGDFSFLNWDGGDVEPDPQAGRVDESCFSLLTF